MFAFCCCFVGVSRSLARSLLRAQLCVNIDITGVISCESTIFSLLLVELQTSLFSLWCFFASFFTLSNRNNNRRVHSQYRKTNKVLTRGVCFTNWLMELYASRFQYDVRLLALWEVTIALIMMVLILLFLSLNRME